MHRKKLGKNQSDSDSDFEDNLTLSEIANVIRIESSDSEFEECLPLCEIVEVRKNDNGKHKRYYTRKRINTKQFQPSNLEHKQLLLSDYEDTCKVDELDGIAPLKSPNVNMYAADRKLYWNEIYLEIISKPSFEQLKSYVNGMSFPQIAQPLYGDHRNDIDEVDPIGVDLLPNDTPSIFQLHTPMKIYGDGNCFLRTISRLVYGDDKSHQELRCRIMIDLVQNFQHYVDDEYLKQNTTYKLPEGVHIGMYFCLYSGADLVPGDELTQEGIEHTLSKEIMNVRHMGQYCGLWEMVLAANVIN